MNLLEHYIKEIHSVTDVTKQFEKSVGYAPKEPLVEVDMTVNCYGSIERKTKMMSKSEFEQAEEDGYYLE